MELKKLKTMAAQLLGVGKHRIWVDASAMERVKESLTKEDDRQLLKDRIVKKRKVHGTSRGRAKGLLKKKKKGRKRGFGKRTGRRKTRMQEESQWVGKIRALRNKLRELKGQKKIQKHSYQKLYKMVKGNFFKGKKALEEYASGEQK